jgi:hypothetical protein
MKKEGREDSLTANVARLHRAASEHSQETKKLRNACNGLLRWMHRNLPRGFSLPRECAIDEEGTFEFSYGPNVIRLRKGGDHDRSTLQCFACLIADDFLEELSDAIEQEAGGFRATTSQITGFITRAPSPASQE